MPDPGLSIDEAFALGSSSDGSEYEMPAASWLRSEDYWSALVLLCVSSILLFSSFKQRRDSRLAKEPQPLPSTPGSLSFDRPEDLFPNEITLGKNEATVIPTGARLLGPHARHTTVQDHHGLFYAVDFAPQSSRDVDFSIPLPWNLPQAFYFAPDAFFASDQNSLASGVHADSDEPCSSDTVDNASRPAKEPVSMIVVDSRGIGEDTAAFVDTIPITEQACITSNGEPTIAPVPAIDPLLAKVERLLDGFCPSGARHHLERGRYLPLLSGPSTATIPTAWLDAMEDAAHLAGHRNESPFAHWLLAHTAMMRLQRADKGHVDMLHAQAMECIDAGCAQADLVDRAFWNALRITNDLTLLRRQSRASLLLGLRHMRVSYSGALSQGSPPVIEAWVAVLLFEAKHAKGYRQLAIYDEAEAFCKKLSGTDGYRHDAYCLHAKVLMQRADIESESRRTALLGMALNKLDVAFEAQPKGQTALAIAKASLDRSCHLDVEEAKQALSHARKHVALAAEDPRWKIESLPCKLAIELASQRLSSSHMDSEVLRDLVQGVETLENISPDILHDIARAHLRWGDFARACALCEQAWRSKSFQGDLLATWREASRHWAATLPQPHQHDTWLRSERQRRIASHAR